MKRELPTIERLHELLYLDDEGVLRWGVSRGRCAAGDEALACVTNRRYRSGDVDGVTVSRASVVFALTHDRWPDGQIFWLDGDTLNDRADNLADSRNGPIRVSSRRAVEIARFLGLRWNTESATWERAA